jgi:hypothetical protein
MCATHNLILGVFFAIQLAFVLEESLQPGSEAMLGVFHTSLPDNGLV